MTANSSLPIAAKNRASRQHVLHPLRNGHDDLIAAEHAELRRNVAQAVELDHCEARHLLARAFGQSEVEHLQELGVIGQAGELVLVGGATRDLRTLGQVAPRPAQLRQRDAGEGDQQDDDAGDERHRPVQCLHHRLRGLEGEKANDAALAVDHRLQFTPGARLTFERQALEADAVLDQVHKARIDFATRPEQVAEFTDRRAQRDVLLGGAVRVALPRQTVADAAAGERRNHRDPRQQDNQTRGRELALRTRARRSR